MKIKEIRLISNLSQAKFCDRYGIPLRTLQSWEIGERKPPEYLLKLLERAIREDRESELLAAVDRKVEEARNPKGLARKQIIDNRFL